MKTNADKDLKQQLHISGRGGWGKPGVNIKQNKKSPRLHKTHFLGIFYIPHWYKQYNRINFGELSFVQINLIIPKATAPKKIKMIIKIKKITVE